jgi:1,4-alpha-glucan branching enzyme
VKPPRSAIDSLLSGTHADPFSLLGVHDGPKGCFARALIPGADAVDAHDLEGKKLGVLDRVDDRGLFEGAIEGKRQPIRYHARNAEADWWITDSYSFGPVLGPIDDLLIAQGSHFRLFDKMGAHLIEHEGASGVHFAVWAPNARRVSVVGDFNDWDGRRHLMRNRVDIGVWEIFIPDIGEWRAYKYEIVGPDGVTLPLKADPFAFASEVRPKTASMIAHPGKPDWGDEAHRAHWRSVDPRREAISIYEVHPGSWDRNGFDWYLNWDEMAERLIPYVIDLGFTHIQFLPVSEHPYDPSWGYQTDGSLRAERALRRARGFRALRGRRTSRRHLGAGRLGARPFPEDAHGLARFDGTALYEHEDPRMGIIPTGIRRSTISAGGRSAVLPRQQRALLVRGLSCRRPARGCRGLHALPRLFAGGWANGSPTRTAATRTGRRSSFLRAMNKAVLREQARAPHHREESTSWPA